MIRYDLLTFGENMIRLSTKNYERLEQAKTLDLRHGGTESNTAVALARLGYRSAWLSRLTDNLLGHRIASDLQMWGVDTDHIVWVKDGRIGTFFLEVGTPPRPSSVLYDRRGSSMSEMTTADFPWALLAETRWLHLTGITAAISRSCHDLVEEAMKQARERGLAVSFDVNYRARLWSTVEAREALAPLCRAADFCFVTLADAARVFGAITTDIEGMLNTLGQDFARRAVVVTMGARGSAALDKSTGNVLTAPAYAVPTTVDRIGSGDAFDAGFIAGYLEEGVERGLRLGNATAALKMTIPGDYALISRGEVDALMAGGGSGISR